MRLRLLLGIFLLLGLWGSVHAAAPADTLPVAVFSEDFRTFAYADGARTTAWWDRRGGRLTLRPADAAPRRRHPLLAAAPAGGMLVVWTEDRGSGPFLWAQQLDAHGNRLWDDDLPLFSWAGDRWSSGLQDRAVALAAMGSDAWLLVWSDDDGVWAYRHDLAAATTIGQIMQLATTPNTDVQARCNATHCVVVWQEAGLSQVRTFDNALRLLGSGQWPGSTWATWAADGTVWLLWPQDSDYEAQRWLPTLEAAAVPALRFANDGSSVVDIAAEGEALLVLTLQPTRLWQLAPTASPQVLATYADAVTGRVLSGHDAGVVLLQTAADDSLWLWLYRPQTRGRLLRLGLPGWEVRLGDAAMTSDAALAVVWLEADKLLVRRWLPGGWSSWRHEVSPAYTPAGEAMLEGLGHSLEVNQPSQAVTSLRLEADVSLLGGSVQFFVSNQGAKQWQPITPGTEIVFDRPGTRLRWYARLRRAANGAAPEIRQLSLHYHYQHVSYWPRQLTEARRP
ncbi:MAG: hypothetical protein GXP37_00370 [Chloroflexi bacterium]|nr:hypothetical protein [Chloroflexota bacterium]